MGLPSIDEIKTAYQAAPQNIKDAIKSDWLDGAFKDIRTTHKLHIDQAGNLAVAIDAVILGMRTLDEFPNLLKEALSTTDAATQDKILAQANQQVFTMLRNKAKEAATAATTTPAGVVAPAVPAKPPEPVPLLKVVEQKLAEPQLQKIEHEEVPMIIEQKLPATMPVSAVPPTPQSPPPMPPRQEAPKTQPYSGVDPYREPVE